jgi:alkylhydroperoxidase family enzyme
VIPLVDVEELPPGPTPHGGALGRARGRRSELHPNARGLARHAPGVSCVSRASSDSTPHPSCPLAWRPTSARSCASWTRGAVDHQNVDPEVYEELSEHFSGAELTELLWAVAVVFASARVGATVGVTAFR